MAGGSQAVNDDLTGRTRQSMGVQSSRHQEQGDLRLRVRTLESERQFKRVAAVQQNIGQANLAATALNLGTMLYINSFRVPALAGFSVSALFGFQVLVGLLKVDNQEKLITGKSRHENHMDCSHCIIRDIFTFNCCQHSRPTSWM